MKTVHNVAIGLLCVAVVLGLVQLRIVREDRRARRQNLARGEALLPRPAGTHFRDRHLGKLLIAAIVVLGAFVIGQPIYAHYQKSPTLVVALTHPISLSNLYPPHDHMGLLHGWVTTDCPSLRAGLEGCHCVEAVSEGVP